MPLNNIVGLDHMMIAVRDLERAAETWRNLGFTVSPRGTHSAHMGTGNYTMMLGDDYLELLGVLAPTERNAPTRELLRHREGMERAAFTTTSAVRGIEELKAIGLEPIGPIDFSRPVELPDGRFGEARFQVYQWPKDQLPAGMGLFACQHFTRDTVWLPSLQRHANTAHRIVRVELVDPEPAGAAALMSRLIDQPVRADKDGGWLVASGAGRGDFLFLSRSQFEMRHADVSLASAPERGAVGLVLEVRDVAAAIRATQGRAEAISKHSVTIPPSNANGVLLVLTV